MNLNCEIKSTDIPNGIVLRGPAGKSVLIDYDEQGKMLNSGIEIEIKKWLPNIGMVIPDDMVILVHTVKGEGQMLVKSLEVNRLLRNGRRFTVQQAAREGVLPKFVEALREKFVEGIKKKAEMQGANTVDVASHD